MLKRGLRPTVEDLKIGISVVTLLYTAAFKSK
jgi:hypothetical protein